MKLILRSNGWKETEVEGEIKYVIKSETGIKFFMSTELIIELTDRRHTWQKVGANWEFQNKEVN